MFYPVHFPIVSCGQYQQLQREVQEKLIARCSGIICPQKPIPGIFMHVSFWTMYRLFLNCNTLFFPLLHNFLPYLFTIYHGTYWAFPRSFRVQTLILFQKFPNILCVKVLSQGRADPVKHRAPYLSVLASHLSGCVSLAVGLIRTFYRTNKIQLSLICIKYDFSGWNQYQSHLFLSLCSWAPSLLNWGHTSSEASCQITPLCSCSSVLANFKV